MQDEGVVLRRLDCFGQVFLGCLWIYQRITVVLKDTESRATAQIDARWLHHLDIERVYLDSPTCNGFLDGAIREDHGYTNSMVWLISAVFSSIV